MNRDDGLRRSISFVGLLWAAPALAVMLAAAAVLWMTPASWGAALHMGVPAWVIPFCGLLMGVPALLIGGGVAWRILIYSRRPYDLMWWHLPFGVTLPMAAFLLIVLAMRIAEPSTYDNLRDSDGVVTSPWSVGVFTLFIGSIGNGFLWICAYMYSQAFAVEREVPREPDVDRVAGLLYRA